MPRWSVILVAALAAAGALRAAVPEKSMPLSVRSPDFAPGQTIPTKHSCDGADLSPAVEWSSPPPGTKSLALVVDDPDAPRGTWTHWLIWNLAADAGGLPQGTGGERAAPAGARQGTNDFRRTGYNGPCPPPGPAHHYYFTLYALDAPLGAAPGADRAAFDKALGQAHVLAKAELIGTYARHR